MRSQAQGFCAENWSEGLGIGSVGAKKKAAYLDSHPRIYLIPLCVACQHQSNGEPIPPPPSSRGPRDVSESAYGATDGADTA